MKKLSYLPFLFLSIILLISSCGDDKSSNPIPQSNNLNISKIIPSPCDVGDTITLKGTKFGTPADSGFVNINNFKIKKYVSWSDTSITFVVPDSAYTGEVFVTVKDDVSNKLPISVWAWTKYGTKVGISTDFHIWKICEDKTGNIWFINAQGTIYKFNETYCQIFQPGKNGVPEFTPGTFNFIGFDSKNNLWAAVPAFLLRYNGSSWSAFSLDAYDPMVEGCYSLFIDKKDNIWFCAAEKIVKFDGKTNWTEMGSFYAFAFGEDSKGNIYAGTKGWSGGFLKFNGTKWDTLRKTYTCIPIWFDEVYRVQISSKDVIWGAIRDARGLVRLDGTKCDYWDGLTIEDLALDKNDNLWLGLSYADYSIAKIDGTSWRKYYRTAKNLLDDKIYSVFMDSKNNLWAGGSYSGLFKYYEKLKP